METITRIHIARIAYDIEVAAHAKLERYLNAVKRGLDNDTAEEVMNDIEARMTELLAERNIHEGDVITTADVRFVEEQLGTPDQFAAEVDTEIGHVVQPRRLLRDTDNALLGGVASGLGLYFNIDPLIFRLAFVALALLGGLGVLLYLLLWVLVPAASSSAEKLQMQGKAVTAATLQNYRQTMERTLRNSGTASGRVVLKSLKIVVTTVAAATLLSIAAGIAIATSALYMQPLRALVWPYHTNFVAVGAVWLFALSLIVMLVLFIQQIWKRKASTARRVAFLSTLALLVVSVTTLAGLAPIIANHYNDLYGNGKTTTALAVTGTAASTGITDLDVTANHTLQVTYIGSDQPLHATYQATPGMRRPNISVKANGTTLTISAPDMQSVVPDCVIQSICDTIYLPVKMVVYGPSDLQNVSVTNGTSVVIDGVGSMNTDGSMTSSIDSDLTLNNGTYNKLTLAASNNAYIFASSSSAQTTTLTTDATSIINAPATTNLIASAPTPTCKDNSSQVLIYLSNMPTSITLNGKPVAPQDVESVGQQCYDSQIGSDQ